MKQLYLEIKANLENKVSGVRHIALWNNQLFHTNDGTTFSFLMPAIFVEFTPPTQIGSVGNNVQIYEPLEVKLHILHEHYDAMDGTMDVNLDVFDFKQSVFKAMQLFQGSRTSVFDRQSEEQDYDHANVYHYVQSYMCALVDSDQPLPVDGFEIDPPLTGVVTPELN